MKTFLKVNLAAMLAALSIAALFALGGCSDPGPTNAQLKEQLAQQQAQVAQQQAQIAKQSEMNANIALINGCKAQGMEEETCSAMLTQMSTGKVQGSPTLSACEAQNGVGKCVSMPMQQQAATGQQASGSSGFSGGEMFVAAATAATAAYIATQWANNRSAPVGAALPRADWSRSQPVVAAPPNPGASAAYANVQKSLPPSSLGKSPSSSNYADMNKTKSDYKSGSVNVKGVNGVDPTKFGVPPSTAAKSAAVASPPAGATTSKFSQSAPSSGYASKTSGSGYSSGSYSVKSSPSSSRSSSSSSSSSSRSSSRK